MAGLGIDPAKRLARRRAWTVSALAVLAVFVAWWLLRDGLPREIRVASAEPGGLYHRLATLLEAGLEDALDRPVSVELTAGSAVNRERVLRGEAHLAVIQAGAVPLDGLAILAPLYADVIHVLARRDRGIVSILDLPGRRVAIGRPGSGLRASAEQLLGHYGVEVETLVDNTAYFGDLAREPDFDGAIVTTGLLNPDLEALLRRQDYTLVPIEDADAFAIRNPLFAPFLVPRGLYAEAPPVPAVATPTLATTAVLVARTDVPDALARATLDALYGADLRRQVPTLLSPAAAAAWDDLPLHPVARRYFDPYGGIDLIASLTESLAAIKELLFAVGAGIWLLWTRRRQARQADKRAALHAMKERLDALLDRTAELERAQMKTDDPETLQGLLDDVTAIKLEAIDELTHEDLRGDRQFLIFLIQCGNLIGSIRAKMALARST